jgi:hypothetical protein
MNYLVAKVIILFDGQIKRSNTSAPKRKSTFNTHFLRQPNCTSFPPMVDKLAKIKCSAEQNQKRNDTCVIRTHAPEGNAYLLRRESLAGHRVNHSAKVPDLQGKRPEMVGC